jgi:hypothetical protein
LICSVGLLQDRGDGRRHARAIQSGITSDGNAARLRLFNSATVWNATDNAIGYRSVTQPPATLPPVIRHG